MIQSILSILLVIIPATQPANQPPNQPAMHVRVVDESGNPLRNAAAALIIDEQRTAIDLDDSGHANIQFPQRGQIVVTAPGHVPGSAYFDRSQPDPRALPPAELTFRLPIGTKIGGTINNEQGDPIVGATIRIFIERPRTTTIPEQITYSLWSYPVTTDAAGHWQTNMAPPTWMNAFVQPSHADYFSPEYLLPQTDEKALRNGTATATMSPGLSISGIVFGPDGNPLPGASVQVGNSLDDRNPKTSTDANGTYHIAHARPSFLKILVRAPGAAPFVEALPRGNVSDLAVHLARPRTLNGRAVDENGHPLANVFVFLKGWGKHAASVREWTRKTDALGLFQLEVPPDASIILAGNSSNDGAADDTTFPADADNIQLVFRKPATITGNVVDAETGQPIKSFHVLGATNDPNYVTDWGWVDCIGADGKYSLAFDSAFKTHRVRIEADDHLPAVSDVLTKRDGKYVFDAALKPAANVSGTLLGVDGNPLAGVRIIDVLKTQGTNLEDARDPRLSPHGTTTNQRGQFSFPPPGEPFDLFVVHESGIARITGEEFEKTRSIRLSPWSRIEGSTGVSNESISMRDEDIAPAGNLTIRAWVNTTTDRYSHFVLDKVPPGLHVVSRGHSTSGGGEDGWETRTVATEAGKTATLNFEASKRRIIGVIEKLADIPADAQFRVSRLTRLEPTGRPKHEAWNGKDYWTADASLNYLFRLNTNGSFVIPNVEPGQYQLVIESSVASPGGYCGEGELVARYSKEITVAPDSDNSIDLGRITLVPAEQVAIGADAPDFELQTFDGTPIKLSNLRGKFVLLEFWATWCGPCIEELPSLITTFERFKRDPRFVMLGMNCDQNRDVAARFISRHNLHWTQVSLGPWDDSPVLRAFHVRGIPSIWLIGPDGKVIAKNLRGDGVSKIVEQALKN